MRTQGGTHGFHWEIGKIQAEFLTTSKYLSWNPQINVALTLIKRTYFFQQRKVISSKIQRKTLDVFRSKLLYVQQNFSIYVLVNIAEEVSGKLQKPEPGKTNTILLLPDMAGKLHYEILTIWLLKQT